MLKIFTVALVTLAIATPALAGGNKNNQFRNWEHNRTYNYNYNYNYNYKYKNKNNNNINPWAAAGVGFLGGLIVGSANQNRYAAPQYAAPQYAAPAPQYGVPVQGINNVPGCYYAAFVDMYGRQYFQQICN